MTHMIEFTFNHVKNIVGERENDRNQHLLLFPLNFEKGHLTLSPYKPDC